MVALISYTSFQVYKRITGYFKRFFFLALFQLLNEILTAQKTVSGFSATELISGLACLAWNEKNGAAMMEFEVLNSIRTILAGGNTQNILR